jgi:hypothetical protein
VNQLGNHLLAGSILAQYQNCQIRVRHCWTIDRKAPMADSSDHRDATRRLSVIWRLSTSVAGILGFRGL